MEPRKRTHGNAPAVEPRGEVEVPIDDGAKETDVEMTERRHFEKTSKRYLWKQQRKRVEEEEESQPFYASKT